MSDRTEDSALGELVDELQVQAWLARRELQEPSVGPSHEKARVLARMRDELRVQLHLGTLEATDRFHEIEAHWAKLVRQDLDPAMKTLGDGIENAVHDLLEQIRDGYQGLVGKTEE